MATYNVEVLRPGVTTGVSGIEREYTEFALKDALDSLEGLRVTDDSGERGIDGVIGEVTDARYDDGVECTVEIFDDEIAERIDGGLTSFAPSMIFDSDEDMEFRYLFLTPHASDLVGEMERIE